MKRTLLAASLIVMSGQAFATPKAISCSLKSVEKQQTFGAGAPTLTEVSRISVFVLDDNERSFRSYDEASKSLKDMCSRPACTLVYGSAAINWSETETHPIMKWQEFSLNRNDGTYYMFVGLGTPTQSTSFKTTGVCQPTAMPSLASSEAKF